MRRLTDAAAEWMIATFLFHVAVGEAGCKKKKDLQAGTLSGYAQAAELWCFVRLGLRPTTRNPDGSLRSMVSDIIADRRNWQEETEKIAALPMQFYLTFHKFIQTKCATDTAWLGRDAACFDWSRLGLFTGSRAGEYSQTVAKRGEYSKVPDDLGGNEWGGWPVAFILDDFTLYDRHDRQLSRSTVWSNPSQIHRIKIRFRFDKSPRNFQFRRFFRSGHEFLCPVLASISIIWRAVKLQVPTTAPIGVFRCTRKGSYQFLKSSDMCTVMRNVIRMAFPDPKHDLRVNISRIVPHCNRVTAAVALYNANWTYEEIAFRLRWVPASVYHYIREASTRVAKSVTDALLGAMATQLT